MIKARGNGPSPVRVVRRKSVLRRGADAAPPASDTEQQAPAAFQPPPPGALFFRALDPALGRSLVSLNKQDHYLQVVTREGEVISENEGCLSVPEYRTDVKRAASVLVEGYDQHEKPLRLEAHGFHAIVLQHEIDHIDGIVFIKRMGRLKASFVRKKMIRRGSMENMESV